MSKVARAVYKEDMLSWNMGAFKNPLVEVTMYMMKSGYNSCVEDSEYLYFTEEEVIQIDNIDSYYTLEPVCMGDVV